MRTSRDTTAPGRALGILALPSTTASLLEGADPSSRVSGAGLDGRLLVAAGEGATCYLWDVRVAPSVAMRRSASRGDAGDDHARPRRAARARGPQRRDLGGGRHGTAPASLALVASNGGRALTYERRDGRRGSRRRRRVSAGSRARTRGALRTTYSAPLSQGDLATWRPMGGGSGGFNYRIAGPVLREVASAELCEGGAVDVWPDRRRGCRRRHGADDDGGDR